MDGIQQRDLKRFPDAVRRRLGFAVYQAQAGLRRRDAKPLKGLRRCFGGSLAPRRRLRAVCTARFEAAVHVLHAFQKKARRDIATPQKELDLARRRLRAAERRCRDTHR